MPGNDPLLSVKGLSVAYAGNAKRRAVLREVGFQVTRGEALGIVGESGSGKSTLLFSIMNYLPDTAVIEAGSVRYDGVDLLRAPPGVLQGIRGRRIAMVYQDPAQSLNPAIKVGDQIAEVRKYHFGESRSAALRRADALLASVGIDAPERIAASYPHELSGGQQQRVMIAIALAGEPDLLVMDEPTTALDVIVQARLLDLIRDLKQRARIAILLVSHDLGAVAAIADRIGVLYAGELMELGPAREMLRRPDNPYTRGLMAAIPRVDARVPIKGIAGGLPRGRGRDLGCVFADRCDLSVSKCLAVRPQLTHIGRSREWLSRCHFAGAAAPASARTAPAPVPTRLTEPNSEDGTALLRVCELSVDYRRLGKWGFFARQVIHAVRNVSFTLRPEHALAIVGESGSGKTTVARTLLRLQEKRAGVVSFGGEDVFAFGADALRRFRQQVQMVFQNPTSSLNPRKTVADLVTRPLRLAGTASDVARDKAEKMLRNVGLDGGMLRRWPHQLSGGEKQRVAIARAFITEPKLVILDEPTTSLDVSVQASILELLARLKAEHRCSYLLISHDLAVVRHVADSVAVMQAGEIREHGDVETVFSEPRHPYTRALLDAARRS